MAATWLGLAGVTKPPQMDGRSLVPLLVGDSDSSGDREEDSEEATLVAALPASTQRHLQLVAGGGGRAGRAAYKASWRSAAFIEYYFVAPNVKCVGGCNATAIAAKGAYPASGDMDCTDLSEDPNTPSSHCWATYVATTSYAL